MSNDLTIPNPDAELAQAIERGEVTREEVQSIWDQTSDMTAQAPITARRAVIAMRKAPLSEKMMIAANEMLRVASNIEGAMTRDESRFSHLVAGAESVAKSMQNIGDIEDRLDHMDHRLGDLTDKLEQLTSVLIEHGLSKVEIDARSDADAEAKAASEPEIDPEQEAERARKKTIGSAWAK